MKSKLIIGFFVYCWQSWAGWQKMIIVSFICGIGSVMAPYPIDKYLAATNLTIIAVLALLFWINSMLLPKWAKYKEERNQLLTTIRDSDK